MGIDYFFCFDRYVRTRSKGNGLIASAFGGVFAVLKPLFGVLLVVVLLRVVAYVIKGMKG